MSVNKFSLAFLLLLSTACGQAVQSSQTQSAGPDANSVNSPGSDHEELAQSFKDIMGDTMVVSEADYPWEAFSTLGAVDAEYTLSQVHPALDVDTDIHIEIYTAEETQTYWWDYLTDPSSEYEEGEAAKYVALKAAMEASLSDIRVIKVGEPDHGELELFLVGRTSDGKLVGLKTIVVET